MGSGYQAPPCYKNLSKLFLLPNPHLPNSTKNKMAVSKIRQNYHEDCEALINKQINMEFYASYVYLSMSSWFNRDDQALHGFAGAFQDGVRGGARPWHETDGIPDQEGRKSCLPGHRK